VQLHQHLISSFWVMKNFLNILTQISRSKIKVQWHENLTAYRLIIAYIPTKLHHFLVSNSSSYCADIPYPLHTNGRQWKRYSASPLRWIWVGKKDDHMERRFTI